MSDQKVFAEEYVITHDRTENFNRRLISMMKEYGITLSDALEWDFEGFGNIVEVSEDEGMLEADFSYYLSQNGVDPDAWSWYTDVFMGKIADLRLKDITSS